MGCGKPEAATSAGLSSDLHMQIAERHSSFQKSRLTSETPQSDNGASIQSLCTAEACSGDLSSSGESCTRCA